MRKKGSKQHSRPNPSYHHGRERIRGGRRGDLPFPRLPARWPPQKIKLRRDARRPREPLSQCAPPRGGPPCGVGCLQPLPGHAQLQIEAAVAKARDTFTNGGGDDGESKLTSTMSSGGIAARASTSMGSPTASPTTSTPPRVCSSTSAPLSACPTSSVSLHRPDAARPLQPWRRIDTVVCHTSDGGSSQENTGRRENTDGRSSAPRSLQEFCEGCWG
jgi:hypothetical protein